MTCEVSANVPTGVAHACSATAISGNAKGLRGTFQVRSAGNGFPPRLTDLR
jgi:hypothetical protein